MHPSAAYNARLFFDVYVSPHFEQASLLEIGSQDVNGSLREIAPPGIDWLGCDVAPGKGVDVVLADPYTLPFAAGRFDVVVTSSCFEHDQLFWLTALEALRVLKPEGLFYLNAPSDGPVHRYPLDCWRFYPDAGKALVAWARRNAIKARLLESYVSHAGSGSWRDFVAVIARDETCAEKYAGRIGKTFHHRDEWTS